MKLISEHKCFGGRQLRYQHQATSLNCMMTFSIFLPKQAESTSVPIIYWLSGLTCSDENFVQKAGAQRYAAEHGIAIVCPDTSPRGEGVPDDENGSYDFGLGAGFYVDATQTPWSSHYHMYSYVTEELPKLIEDHFNVDGSRQGISGHSMGGHGALTIGIKHQQRFKSISAFAPILAPSQCPWGEKALSGYLGEDRSTWQTYDSYQLLKQVGCAVPILIDQGLKDEFLQEQLHNHLLDEFSYLPGLTVRRHPGYDHSYFYIASFIGEHIAFHARHLK
ncbi:S-formylglutathione hydrolase [Thalassotalea ganghwensis]